MTPGPTTPALAPSAAPRGEFAALLRLAGPVIVSQFASNALTLVGTAVIGRLGPAPLAAAAYANTTYYLVFVVPPGVMLSVGPRAAQAHGAGDAAAVGMILSFLASYREQTGATIVLTSHYMADVEALCSRVILIDRGEIVHDSVLSALSARLAPHKLLRVTLASAAPVRWER